MLRKTKWNKQKWTEHKNSISHLLLNISIYKDLYLYVIYNCFCSASDNHYITLFSAVYIYIYYHLFDDDDDDDDDDQDEPRGDDAREKIQGLQIGRSSRKS